MGGVASAPYNYVFAAAPPQLPAAAGPTSTAPTIVIDDDAGVEVTVMFDRVTATYRISVRGSGSEVRTQDAAVALKLLAPYLPALTYDVFQPRIRANYTRVAGDGTASELEALLDTMRSVEIVALVGAV